MPTRTPSSSSTHRGACRRSRPEISHLGTALLPAPRPLNARQPPACRARHDVFKGLTLDTITPCASTRSPSTSPTTCSTTCVSASGARAGPTRRPGRLEPGHRPGLPARPAGVLGRRLRLAGAGAVAQPLRPPHRRRGRRAGPLRPPSPAGRRRAALVLTHGWPSTFVELLPLVDRLGDRFDLVVPVAARLRLLAAPAARGVDRAFVAAPVAPAHAGPRVRAVRRARRRLRRRRRHPHGAVAARPDDRHPPQHAGDVRRTPGRARRRSRPRSRRTSTTSRAGTRPSAATARSSPPGRRPSGTGSTTRRPGWPPGCWTSGAPGRTAAATSTPGSVATPC